MGIEEYTCRDEHQVMYGIVESYCTHETPITLCINCTGIKLKKINVLFGTGNQEGA